MTCTACNGWGVMFRISTTPPTTAEKRLGERKKGAANFLLKETVCMSCGGFGTKSADRLSGHR